ncbi:MAG: hypothetical protein ACYC4R_07650 [Anaerolineae bacterium]
MLVILALLIAAEQVQDHRSDAAYRAQRGRKLHGSGAYECQYCGNRVVSERDRRCGVCGRAFMAPENDGAASREDT